MDSQNLCLVRGNHVLVAGEETLSPIANNHLDEG